MWRQNTGNKAHIIEHGEWDNPMPLAYCGHRLNGRSKEVKPDENDKCKLCLVNLYNR